MSELDGALLVLSLITCGVTGVFAMVVVIEVRARVPRSLPRRKGGSYVPFSERGVTPLSKGKEPYSNAPTPLVPPSGPAASSTAHRHEYLIHGKWSRAECLFCRDSVQVVFDEPANTPEHLHRFPLRLGQRVATCDCGFQVFSTPQ